MPTTSRNSWWRNNAYRAEAIGFYAGLLASIFVVLYVATKL